MTILLVGVILFIGIHIVPMIVPLRALLKENLSDRGYQGLFSLFALAGLIIMIYGKAEADFVHIWSPPYWSRYLAWVVMLPALFLIVAANLPGNIKRMTPHPMMWAVLLWGSVHLFANGDLASMILFGSMAGFACIHIVSANSRGASNQVDVLPITADLKVVAIAIVVYLIIASAHSFLFKVSAF